MNKNETTYGGTQPSKDEVQSTGLTEEGRREAQQIEQNIAQTRAEMTGTLDEIHGKLNPTALKEQAIDQFHETKERIKAEIKAELSGAKAAVRDATVGRVQHAMHSTGQSVRHTGASFVDTVKRNPIPAAMVGVGTAWLVVQSRRRNGMHYGSPDESDLMHEPAGERMYASERTYATGESMRELGGERSRTTTRIKQAAGERMKAANQRMKTAGERVQRLRQDAQQRGRQLEHRAQSVFEENPLLIGAAAAAAGALLGLAIPISRREDRMLGSARDKLMDKAQSKAQTALDKAQGKMQGALDKAQGTLDKAKETLDKAQDATRRIGDEFPRGGGSPSTTR